MQFRYKGIFIFCEVGGYFKLKHICLCLIEESDFRKARDISSSLSLAVASIA